MLCLVFYVSTTASSTQHVFCRLRHLTSSSAPVINPAATRGRLNNKTMGRNKLFAQMSYEPVFFIFYYFYKRTVSSFFIV